MMSDSPSRNPDYKPIRFSQARRSPSQASPSRSSQFLPKTRALPNTQKAQSLVQLQSTFSANHSSVSRSSEVAMQSVNSDQGLPEKMIPNRDFLEGNFLGDDAYSEPQLQKAFSEDEKLELLSAYMDGEVSIHEQQLVRQWLASDAQLNQYYQHQLKLSRAIQSLPANFLDLEASSSSESDLSASDSVSKDLIETPYLETPPSEVPPSDSVFLQNDAGNFSVVNYRRNQYFPYDLRQRHWPISRAVGAVKAQPKGSGYGLLGAIALDDGLRRGLMFVAALSAATVTLLASGLADRLRPGNLNRLKGLSSQVVQGQAL